MWITSEIKCSKTAFLSINSINIVMYLTLASDRNCFSVNSSYILNAWEQNTEEQRYKDKITHMHVRWHVHIWNTLCCVRFVCFVVIQTAHIQTCMHTHSCGTRRKTEDVIKCRSAIGRTRISLNRHTYEKEEWEKRTGTHPTSSRIEMWRKTPKNIHDFFTTEWLFSDVFWAFDWVSWVDIISSVSMFVIEPESISK